MTSEVAICNQAISWLGGNLIVSLDDQTVEAVLCNANYDILRDAVMEEGKWTFGTRRMELAQSATAPAFGYEFAYTIPPEVLTIIFATQYEHDESGKDPLDWRREEDTIVTNAGRLFVKTMVRIVDVSKFSAMFQQALAARIAADIAVALTESTTKEANMWTKYANSMVGALAVDGMQGKSDRIRSQSRLVRGR